MSRNTKTKSKKPAKTTKAVKTKKLSSKKTAKAGADYITVAGHVYEKVSSTSKEIEFDLAEDVLNTIDNYIESGKYVSRGDAIRDILRRVMDSEEGLK